MKDNPCMVCVDLKEKALEMKREAKQAEFLQKAVFSSLGADTASYAIKIGNELYRAQYNFKAALEEFYEHAHGFCYRRTQWFR